jgi:hypothetical protein
MSSNELDSECSVVAFEGLAGNLHILSEVLGEGNMFFFFENEYALLEQEKNLCYCCCTFHYFIINLGNYVWILV